MNTTNQIRLWSILAGVLALNFLPARVHASPPQYIVTDLRTIGGTYSVGSGINASGQVAGVSNLTGDSATHAVRWTGTTPTDLGTLGGTASEGSGINASGQVVGDAFLAGNSTYHAVRWTGTTPTDLGTLGGSRSVGFGINVSGQVAGWSNPTGSSAMHAVRWTGTTATDLGTLGGTHSVGYSINASGQVVGWSEVAGQSAAHAVRWTGTTPTDLGTFGGTNSVGYGINDYGDVTGVSGITGDTATHAFLYTGGTMYDLSTLILPGSGVIDLRVASGANINNLGQIAATGTIGGQTHALLLTPATDTDGDGIPDLFETGTGIYVSPTDTGTDPNNPDTDGDGLTDGEEVNRYHSNPNVKNTDGDGFDDGFEVATGFDPTSATSTPDAASSIRTAAEYRFNAASGISYRIEGSTDLANWTTLETNIIGTGGVITRFYSMEGQSKRFFRSRRN